MCKFVCFIIFVVCSGGNSNGAFKLGVRYSNQDLTVDLPAGTNVCDIGTFTVWCEQAAVFFSVLKVNPDVFVSALVKSSLS